ncbi:MAG: wax ester/triacylglycerol synthase family O-acyltransferase [Aquihabitans sp.]
MAERFEMLPAQDATLLRVQTQDAPLNIGGVCILEGAPLRDESGALRLDALRRHVLVQLEHTPRFRQVLQALPLGQGLGWFDDERFDVTRHVRSATVPDPGGKAELRQLVARLLEEPLDPTHPMWELWLIDGMPDDRVGLVFKVSHVLADGMAVVDVAMRMLDFQPRDHDAEPSAWSPTSSPAPVPLLVRGVAERVRRAWDGAWEAGTWLLDPRVAASALVGVARLATSGTGLAPALPITQPVGSRRDMAWTRLAWADVIEVKRAASVTVNDVVLTVVAGALSRYLGRSGISPEGRAPRVLVPVSIHGDTPGEVANRFSMVVTNLPMGPADPLERLQEVHADMERHKLSAATSAWSSLFSLVDLAPPWLLSTAGPAILRRQPFVNLAVTNLPGSPVPLYLLGARLLEMYPFIGVTGNLGAIIGVLSYEDALGLSITVDADVISDVDALLDDCKHALQELVDSIASTDT